MATHQDKAEDIKKLKKYNTTQLQNIPYCSLPFVLSCKAK